MRKVVYTEISPEFHRRLHRKTLELCKFHQQIIHSWDFTSRDFKPFSCWKSNLRTMDNPLEMMCEEKHIYAVSGDHAVVHNKLLTPPLKGQTVAHQYTPNVGIYIYTYIYIHIHIYIYTYIYTYIYITIHGSYGWIWVWLETWEGSLFPGSRWEIPRPVSRPGFLEKNVKVAWEKNVKSTSNCV